MARSKKPNRERPLLATLLTISFIFGVLLGVIISFTWIGGAPVLQLSPDEVYTSSITIVGIDKNTGEGMLAVLTVELRPGSGRLTIAVPPYENEDTQEAALDARNAAELTVNKSLSQVDIVIVIENIAPETTMTGPSASAAIAVLIVATINANENTTPCTVRQDAVVSAAIDSTGRLKPVGEIVEKYQTVAETGDLTLFVVARNQSGNLGGYPSLSVERALNLNELVDIILQ